MAGPLWVRLKFASSICMWLLVFPQLAEKYQDQPGTLPALSEMRQVASFLTTVSQLPICPLAGGVGLIHVCGVCPTPVRLISYPPCHPVSLVLAKWGK